MTTAAATLIRKIGYETIHDQQWEVATNAYNSMMRYVRIPIISMQPQQGKTGTGIVIVHQFIEAAIKHKKTFQIVVISALNSNELRNQLLKDMTVCSENNGQKRRGADLGHRALSSEYNRAEGRDGIL